MTGAIEKGSVQVGSDCKVGKKERGGCVEGVRIRYVRAMSRGASATDATADAESAIRSDVRGEGEARMSRPPTGELPEGVSEEKAGSPAGSGKDRSAERRERIQVLRVEKTTLYRKVLLVPFQIPHAPSAVQSCDRMLSSEDGSLG